MKKYVMALDQGTTSSRCILFDRAGKICSMAQKEYTQYYPKPGWVEHDPLEIWSSQLSVAVEAMGKLGVTAAEIAKTFGVRVYTIGVGTKGMAPYPFQTAFGVQYQNIPVEIDEATLKQIASTTGGQYFRATDNASLKEIYSEIDQMEKTKISVQQYSKKQEEYKNWAILLFALLLVEIVIRNTLVRNIP